MSDPKTLGLMATVGSGIGSLRGAGQDTRLTKDYFSAYLAQFDRLYYFSHLEEKLEDFVQDPEVLRRVKLLPRRWNLPKHLYALVLPFAYPAEFAACGVFRVFQAIGALPLWRAGRRPSLVTYGYRYAQMSRIDGRPWWNVLWYGVLERLAFRWATVILTTTPAVHEFCARRRKDRPVVYVPNGVNVARFAPRPGFAARNAEVKTVLFVGRLEKVKNLETLIKAVSLVSRSVRTRLILAGDGAESARLKDVARQEGVAVEFRGVVPHELLPELMRSSDMFALVSLLEGSPKVLQEAMAAGLPCVVSDSAETRALISDGVTGLLCQPEDVAGIARALERVLTSHDLASALGSRARALIEKRFDLTRILRGEAALLRRMADGKFPDAAPRLAMPSTRWLDRSCRRRFLDRDLSRLNHVMDGDVLEIGGGRLCERGLFDRPRWRANSWVTVNIDPAVQPDVVADAEHLPLTDASADTVVSFEVLEYIPSPKAALREMCRVLRGGGRVVLSVPFTHRLDNPADKWRFHEGELRRLFRSADLNVERIVAQGGRLGGWAHLMKTSVRRTKNRWLRHAFAVLAFPLVEGLCVIDRVSRILPGGKGAPTGYIVVAGKAQAAKSRPPFSPAVLEKMRGYYTRYYHDTLGLPDWEARVETRCQEEGNEDGMFARATKGMALSSGMKFLNVGCGTGGMNLLAAERGFEAHGVEIAEDALEICREKAGERGFPASWFVKGVGEALPYPDDTFDLVYSHSVLEHVQDVRRVVHEMVRVTRPGGRVYINAPTYLAFHEGHYKIFWLPKFPKPLAKIYLRLRGRKPGFVDSLNYTTAGSLLRDLAGQPVSVEEAAWPLHLRQPTATLLKRTFYTLLGIKPAELWVTKLSSSEIRFRESREVARI